MRVEIMRFVFVFTFPQGWRAEESKAQNIADLLNNYWRINYGVGGACYDLTVESKHVQAIVKLFDGKIISVPKKTTPEKEDVVY